MVILHKFLKKINFKPPEGDLQLLCDYFNGTLGKYPKYFKFLKSDYNDYLTELSFTNINELVCVLHYR